MKHRPRDRWPGRGEAAAAPRVDVDLVQLGSVALVQRVDHDVRVERQLLAGRGAGPEQPLSGVPRHTLRDRGQLLEGRVLGVWFRPQAPHRAVRNVVGAENRPFPLDELGVERIAVGQLRQRFDGLTLF